MDPETLEALKESIQHWERMRDGKQLQYEVPTADCCPLCDLYSPIDADDCDRCIGCPVFFKTMRKSCYGSPYYEAYHAWEWRFERPESWKPAAQSEIDFLKSLLPKDEIQKPR